MDAEITAVSGKTERGRRNSRLDSEHEPSEPVVGSSPHARGTEQVGNRSSTVDRGQISLPTEEAAFPDLADVLDQSLGTDGLDRLLRGADGDVPGSVCVRGLVACSASCAALSGDRTPQPRVDDAADAGGVLSPAEQRWLDGEIDSGNGRFTDRVLKAMDSREYDISTVKSRFALLVPDLQLLSHVKTISCKDEVLLWAKVASRLADRGLWRALVALVERKVLS